MGEIWELVHSHKPFFGSSQGEAVYHLRVWSRGEASEGSNAMQTAHLLRQTVRTALSVPEEQIAAEDELKQLLEKQFPGRVFEFNLHNVQIGKITTKGKWVLRKIK